jgi:hypothetical protein
MLKAPPAGTAALGALVGAPAGLLGKKTTQETPVKNKYAGVTLDWYDDRGATLKSKFQTLDALPDIIKEADIRPKEKLAHEDFALVAIDEGNVMRKFACHDPGTTAMSVIYFMEHGDKLPEGAQKLAAANLVEACERFDLTPPEALEKTSWGGGKQHAKDLQKILKNNPGMSMSDAIKKYNTKYKKASANVVDVTGKRPAFKVKVARPVNNDDYAVVMPDGSRHYPINSWDLIKKAENYYHDEGRRMDPEIRRQFAVKLASKATMVGYLLDPDIFEAGSTTFAAPGHLKAAVEMRKIACAPGDGRVFLDELFEKRASIGPEVYSECLRRFDVEAGLDRGWDRVVLDPWASTYGIDKTAKVVWEQGAERVTAEELTNLANNHSGKLDEHFSAGFSGEFKKDPISIFKSMPDPQKKMLSRMAVDSSSQGEQEFAPTGTDKK